MTLLAGLALSAVAQATNPPPRLTSIGAPKVTLGATGIRTFAVPFAAVDGGSSGLQQVYVEYRLRGIDPSNHTIQSSFAGFWYGTGQSSASGDAVGTMDKWVASGTYDVAAMTVINQAGSRTV